MNWLLQIYNAEEDPTDRAPPWLYPLLSPFYLDTTRTRTRRTRRSRGTSTSLLDETLVFALDVANEGDEGDTSKGGSGFYL